MTQKSKSACPPNSLYAAFDTFPAPKGAAVHIREFSQTLFDKFPPGLLLALGNEELPSWQIEENAQIRRLASTTQNFLKRTLEFGQFVHNQVETVKSSLKIAHFRDPWSGMPILGGNERNFKTVFEVNALPSIELPSKYPGLNQQTLDKIRKIELHCLLQADRLICPSQTIKDFIVSLIGNEKKIDVIANGADLPATMPEKPAEAPESYLIYFGAVQPWQGLEVLFKAMQFLRDFDDLYLVLCVSGSKPRLKYLQKLGERMGIENRLIWNLRLKQNEVHRWLAHARLSIAPLVECSRNLVQGCCPLKIVESMAYGIPVVASDMPVVRELMTHQHNGWLVRPDRPAELARAMRLLLENSGQAQKLGKNAQQLVREKLTWQASAAQLQRVYDELCQR